MREQHERAGSGEAGASLDSAEGDAGRAAVGYRIVTCRARSGDAGVGPRAATPREASTTVTRATPTAYGGDGLAGARVVDVVLAGSPS